MIFDFLKVVVISINVLILRLNVLCPLYFFLIDVLETISISLVLSKYKLFCCWSSPLFPM